MLNKQPCGGCGTAVFLEYQNISPGRGNYQPEIRLMPIMSDYYLKSLEKYYCSAKCSLDDYELI